MKHSACLMTFMTLLSGACGDNGSGGNSDSNGSTSAGTMTSGINTFPTTAATEPTTMGEGSANTMASTTDVMVTDGTTEPVTTVTTGFDPNDCGESVVNIPIVTPSVMLVLDKSGSMVADTTGFWDHDADDADGDGFKDADPAMMATPKITRWQSLWEVTDLIANGFNGSMNLGMVLFPSKTAKADYNEVACIVSATPEVPVGPSNAAKIIAAIPGATSNKTIIQGGTPATKGIKTAVAELKKAPADQPKFMILVTDGAANCQENAPDTTTLFEQYDAALAPTIADAAAAGIKTYVVGIDISQETSPVKKEGNPDNVNTYEKLNEVATAGGVPRPGDEKFFNTTNQEELQAALEMISMQILSCTLDLNPAPVYLDYVEVSVKEVYGKTQVTDCATEDGWHYVPMANPDDPVRIELCGAACSDFQVTGMIDIQYRCPNSG